MAKTKISDYDTSAAGNTDIDGIGIQGSNQVLNFDNAFRELMSQLADMNAGTSPIFDNMRWCDPSDNTKIFRFDGVGITTASTRVYTVPDVSSTMAVLGLAQTWTATQTFASAPSISGAGPALNFTDTDTGADSAINANNSTGSLVITADSNNEVASSTVLIQIDGATKATFDANGGLSLNGSVPVITLTDTDSNADSLLSANSSTGSLSISADANNEVASSIISFSVDGTQRATINGSGEMSVTGNFFQNFSALPSFASSTTAGIALDPNGTIYASRSGGSSLAIQRTTSDGSVVTFTRQTTSVGSISVTASATAYNTSSDGRLKKNRKALLNSGAVIDALQPLTYDWVDVPGASGVGFIAQDLHAIVPEAVRVGDGDMNKHDRREEGFDMWEVDLSKIVPYLVAELKDVRARLAALEAE